MISKGKLDNLSSIIAEVGRRMKEKHQEEKVADSISHLCLGALKFVAEAGKPTMKNLADHFGITPPSATAMIEPLAESRLLIRDADGKDRRVIHLSLTDKGRKVLQKNLQLARKKMENILSKMEEEEIDNLYSGLSHLLKIIKEK